MLCTKFGCTWPSASGVFQTLGKFQPNFEQTKLWWREFKFIHILFQREIMIFLLTGSHIKLCSNLFVARKCFSIEQCGHGPLICIIHGCLWELVSKIKSFFLSEQSKFDLVEKLNRKKIFSHGKIHALRNSWPTYSISWNLARVNLAFYPKNWALNLSKT